MKRSYEKPAMVRRGTLGEYTAEGSPVIWVPLPPSPF